jgi:hypothetical protein
MPLSMTFFSCALSKLIEVGFSALSRYANWIRRNKEQRDVLQCDLDDREATLREHPDFDEVHDDDPSVISKWKLILVRLEPLRGSYCGERQRQDWTRCVLVLPEKQWSVSPFSSRLD